MKKKRFFFSILFCLMASAYLIVRRNIVKIEQAKAPVASAVEQKILSKEVTSALETSPSITLYSLHWKLSKDLKDAQRWIKMIQPDAPPIKEVLGGYPVLGKMQVTGTKKNALIQAFYGGISKPTWMASCFMPRHAMRLKRDGKIYDFIICFECHQFSSPSQKFNQPINQSAQPVFNAILKSAGVPLAR